MENEHSELIIGYLQGRLQGRSLDDFYMHKKTEVSLI